MDGYALNDIPRGGVENMALDQHMLETAAAQQCLLLRVYRWSEPTLSLGYFQPYVQRLTHSPSTDLPLVRRATGGGAIVHHYDWTYSIAAPAQALGNKSRSSKLPSEKLPGTNLPEHAADRAQNPASGQVSNLTGRLAGRDLGASVPLYDCVHDAVVTWLAMQGIAARKWSQDCGADAAAHAGRLPNQSDVPEQAAGTPQHTASAPQPAASGARSGDMQRRFLCFERRSCGDVVWQDHKVMGSAQRRSAGALLQHGSLLLASSPYAPSLQGLSPSGDLASRSLLGGAVPPAELLQSFFEHLCAAVSAATGVELRPVAGLEQTPCQWQWPSPTRFAEADWTHRM